MKIDADEKELLESVERSEWKSETNNDACTIGAVTHHIRYAVPRASHEGFAVNRTTGNGHSKAMPLTRIIHRRERGERREGNQWANSERREIR